MQYFACISRVYRFIQFLEIAFSRTKENQSFPFTFPLSRQIFHHFEELSLSLSLQVEFIPWDIINVLSLGRASMKKGKKVAFIIRHISTLSSRMFLSGMEQRLDPRIHYYIIIHYFSSFPSNRDPFPYFLESFSTNGDPWSLANSRALNTKVWKGFAGDPFSKVFLIDTGNVERGWNRASVRREYLTNLLSPGNDDRVLYSYHICDVIYNWWTTDETRHDMFVIFR